MPRPCSTTLADGGDRDVPATEDSQAAEDRLARGVGRKATVELGLVVTTALDASAVEKLVDDLTELLARRYPGVSWRLTVVREPLVTPPAAVPDLIDAARSRMLDEDWDLVVYVTEFPLRISRRPLLTHSSPTHGVALVSLPALGPLQRRRLAHSVAEAVGMITGDTAQHREQGRSAHRRRIERRLAELATDVEGSDALEGISLLHRVVTGNLRLIAGMVRANHPFRLATRLSRALTGALGVAAFAIVTTELWRISSSMSASRLIAICVLTVGGAVWALVAAHGLWERARESRVREQVMLFNVVTLITVSFGILALYCAVCVLGLAAALLMIEPSLLSAQIGHRSDLADYVRLALLAAALATVGGALGGALESDAAVREATYAYRSSRNRSSS
jgi:uncharacterized membrane protein